MGVPGYVQPVLDRAMRAFRGRFDREPVYGAYAPGRVNLIGEHTDYNGGFVLPIAIDRVCVAVAGPSGDAAVTRIVSDDMGQMVKGDLAGPLVVRHAGNGGAGVERGSWGSYVLGVLEQFRNSPNWMNLDVAIASSVPLGSGLSSSASLEVGVASIAEQAFQRPLEPLERARICQKAEHDFAGVPCGIMDMLSSIMGRAGHAMLIDCESCTVRSVPLPRELAVVVVNSHVKHALAGSEYAQRRAACMSAARKLGVPSLRHASVSMLGSALTDEEARCARHVMTECQRTLAAAKAMESSNPASLGALFAASHESLRDDFRVSCRELDVLVELAAREPGVIGARMTGGGFGGCIVALVHHESADQAMDAIVRGYRQAIGIEGTAFVVSPAEGAGVLTVS